MRNVFLTVCTALALCSSAFAVDGSSSWDAIDAAGLRAEFPQVQFGTTFVGVQGVCVDGDNLKTLEPVERCVHRADRGENADCDRTVSSQLTTPRTYTYQHCVAYSPGEGGSCVHWVSRTAVIPLSYEVPVFKVTDAGESGLTKELLFSKHFEIGSCDNGKNGK